MADAPVVELVDVAEGAVDDGPADVVLTAGQVRCVLATGRAEGGRAALGVLDAALARWAAAEQGTLSLAPVGITAPCEGLPAVDAVTLPPGGWAVGLKRPAVTVLADGPAVHRVGEDGRWWHVLPWEGVGTGGIAFTHDKGPPTRILARMDPQHAPPEGLVVQVPLHGVAVADLEAPAAYAAVVQDGLARVVPLEQRLLVLGRAAGVAEGVIREGDRTPRSLEVVVGNSLPPADTDLRVRSGGRKWLKSDRQVAATYSAAPEVVDTELRGPRLGLVGREPGRAQIALLTSDGEVFVITVAVGG